MIIGEFKGIWPYVSAMIGIPRLGVFGKVDFLVDTGASATCLHPRDAAPLQLPFERLQRGEYVAGVGGSSQRFRERVTLTFTDADSPRNYVYHLDVFVGTPEQVGTRLPSLLGQDVLSRLVMAHDPAIGRLQFHARNADDTRP